MAIDETYSADEPTVATSETNGAETHWPPAGDETFWHDCAPSGVRRHYDSVDLAGGWKRWRRHLLGRSSWRLAEELTRELAGSRKRASGALAWGCVDCSQATSRVAWLARIADARPRRTRELATAAPAHIEHWLADTLEIQTWAPAVDDALEAVAWARALASLARVCEGEIWWQLLRRLCHLAAVAHVPLDDSPLAHQLARGELPWSLAALFPEIQRCRQFAPAAAKAISAGIAELLDGTGVPQGRFLPVFHPLVASWTRSKLLAVAASRAAKKQDSGLGDCWDADAEQEFPQAVREALRLSRDDGTAVLSAALDSNAWRANAMSGAWLCDVAVAIANGVDKHYRRAMHAVAAGRGLKVKNSRSANPTKKYLPDPAFNSEWAELAVLQTDWSSRATRLTVAYGGPNVRLELQSDRELMLGGTWELEIRVGGILVEPRGSWSEVCWVSDADCDYLELEMEFSGSVRVQRQMLLSRKDEFLFLADAMLGTDAIPNGPPKALTYRGRLPLAPGLTAQPAVESRELILMRKKPRAVVLPLALPEWRVDPRGGSLIGSGETVAGLATPEAHAANGAASNGAVLPPASDSPMHIELTQVTQGRRLFAPLWFDLSRKRARSHDRDPLTWRQLTVGEQRQILDREVAVGYRVQCGKRQWLVYRSLAEPANRTLLGTNLSTDFFIGRFGSDGETESIVEVE